jgi:hypothetical protein
MFDHIGMFVSDVDKSVGLLESCLAPLGITVGER